MSTNIPADLRYTRDDEWLRVEGDNAFIGVSDYAQDSLSDIVYIELPPEGATFQNGDTFGVLESVKAAADLMMPVSGTVLEVNEDLVDEPELINGEPYESWMIKITLSNPSEVEDLMDAEAYKSYCEERG